MRTDENELKNLLHESIENIDDQTFLEAVKDILDQKYVPAKDLSLNEYQEGRINVAKLSIEKGDYLSNEQADQLVEKWINK